MKRQKIMSVNIENHSLRYKHNHVYITKVLLCISMDQKKNLVFETLHNGISSFSVTLTHSFRHWDVHVPFIIFITKEC